jgi:hypothetical protein
MNKQPTTITLTDEQSDLLYYLLDMHERAASDQTERDLAHSIRRLIDTAEDSKGGDA